MKIVWSPAALHDIQRIADYLRAFNPRAAAEVMAALIETGDGLVNFPWRGRQVPRSQLREVISTYPYIIRYRIIRDELRILGVRHTSRRPTNP